MRYFSLAAQHRNNGWFLHPITGNLHQTHNENLAAFISRDLPEKIISALEYCDNPYKLLPPKFEFSHFFEERNVISLQKIYRKILFLRRLNFFLVTMYAGQASPLFADSLQAFFALNKIGYSAKTDPNGCLNRTLIAAKCSHKFQQAGVLFIGADLPQTRLHAWIIEDNYQPDPWDRDWINFLPLAAYIY
ncbi:hypothetical protein [Polynucleobacter sp.]|uniref:hypothetical protein n=1 Tax=Polynucleobacter sp. TaxID=2029855 RepID=UPI00262C5F7F|nr:hypothetical protein [Polynucleobacter sp.]MCW1966047.1 hypothetical protein [Polynucleobacter sp.]